MRHLADFFATAREREWVRLRREAGQPPPWTSDPALGTTRLCNVFREDDRTSRWLLERVIRPMEERRDPRVLTSVVAFRWFGRIETGEAILPWLDGSLPWRDWDIKVRLYDMRHRPLFTGAYMIKSPPGESKVTGVLACIGNVRRHWEEFLTNGAITWPTLKTCYDYLRQFPFLGPFMAYQAVRDLRHTFLLAGLDLDTWTVAGPGCARGLGWVADGNPNRYSYTSKVGQERMVRVMRNVLDASREARHWPHEWRPWTLQEVETWMCEYAKICVVRRGGVPKRRFSAEQACGGKVPA